MDNGDSIIGEGWFNELVIIPFPDSDSLFYLFSICQSSGLGLFYSIIDLHLNGGLGSVIQKNVLLNSSIPNGVIKTIKHGNGRDWWLIYRTFDVPDNNYVIYMITPYGISQPQVQYIGSNLTAETGDIDLTPDGNKLLIVNWHGLIQLMDFDRCTGTFSNPEIIQPDTWSTPLYLGCAFSPDANKIYVTSVYQGAGAEFSYLYQYDLLDTNIALSKDTLYTFTAPDVPRTLRRGPDNKIYLSTCYETPGVFAYPYADSVRNSTNENLSVINSPDSLGPMCDFAPFSFYLGGKRTYYGLPNNPDYDLKSDSGSFCDTLLNVSSMDVFGEKPEINIFYHPSWQKLFINGKNLKSHICIITLFDLTGKVLFQKLEDSNSLNFSTSISCGDFSNGIYLIAVQTEYDCIIKTFFK